MLKVLFNLPVRDPQGTIFINLDKVRRFIKYCDADNAFFTTQLAIYSYLYNLRIIEIPVTLFEGETRRKSRYKIIKDGWEMIILMIAEYNRYRKLKGLRE